MWPSSLWSWIEIFKSWTLFFEFDTTYKPNIPSTASMFINSNVKNKCDILSNEFVQDFLENLNFRNATKLWPLSKRSGPIVQCGSFTYLMDSLTNFLTAFVPKICKRVANFWKYRDCSGPKIQNCTLRFDEKTCFCRTSSACSLDWDICSSYQSGGQILEKNLSLYSIYNRLSPETIESVCITDYNNFRKNSTFIFANKKLKKTPQKVAYLWQLGGFFLCSPDCPKQPRSSFPFYKFLYSIVSAKVSASL